MKFALFLVCALVAFQGYHAYSVEPETRDLKGLVDTIKEIIQEIKNAIQNISSQLPQIIQNIKDKIQEISANLPNIIKQLKEKIQELVNLGAAGKKCVEEQRGEIEALAKLAKDGLKACVAEAQIQTEELQQQIVALVNKANDVKDDILKRALKCYEDNKSNPLALIWCLKSQVGPVKQEAAELVQEIKKTLIAARETAEQIDESLKECVREVQEEVGNKEADIYVAIKKCIYESS